MRDTGYRLLAIGGYKNRLRAAGVLLAMVVLGGVGLLAGCFSEHEAATAVAGECTIELNEAFPGSTVVVIQRFAFGPADVRVRAGERVTWLNCDEDVHTSTADGSEWASPLLQPGEAFTQTFATAGEFPYHCDPHPFMTGRVIVE
jgi:plastocyanin